MPNNIMLSFPTIFCKGCTEAEKEWLMHRDISRKKMIRNAVIDEVLETIDEEIEKRNNILGLSIVYDKVKAMNGYGDADPDARLWEGEYEE